MRYKNGMVGIYTTGTGENPGTNRLEISCDMGKIVYEGGKLTFWKNEMSEREFNRINTASFPKLKNEKIEIEIPELGMQPHNALLENFASAICCGTPLLAPGSEGIDELTLADAFYYSDWLGQVWVSTENFDHEGFHKALLDKIEKSTYVKKSVRESKVDMSSSY